MKLLQLTATFGCLENETLNFDGGFTLIGAPNGAGKSTWCAFLRTMLYGLDTRQRDKKGAPADKNRYRPWSGAPMEGRMICRQGDRTLEIRRTSAGGVPMGEFSAIDRDTGLPVPGLTADNVGETLTGVSREVFDRSVFLRQTNLAVTHSQELEKRMAALVTAGEEDVSWSEADERLRTWQRRRRYHKSGLLPQLEEEEQTLLEAQRQTADLRQSLAQAQARADALRRQKEQWDNRLALETDKLETVSQQRYAEAAAALDAAQLRLHTLGDREEAEQEDLALEEELSEEMAEIKEELKGRKRLMTGFVLVVVLLTLGCAALFGIPRYIEPNVADFPVSIPILPLFLYAAVAGVLWVLVVLFTLIKAGCDHRSRKELAELRRQAEENSRLRERRERTWTEALAQRDQARKYFEAVSQQGAPAPNLPPEAETCRTSLHAAEQEVANLQGRLDALGDPVLVDARLDSVRERIALLQADYDAMDVALEALRESDSQLHARFSPQLSDRAGTYFTRLTGGRYTRVDLSRGMELTVREGESLTDQPLAYLSQGTADQLYLALRLAVADLVLPEPDQAPVVLDDALITLDDTRLTLALETLLELSKDRQVILFTCQSREFRVLENHPEVRTVRLAGF
ncbi:MAG: AAA family ATPase [Bacillota bacterium]|nr:AAA family ATPase [Bacillota bacterium]